MSRVIVAILLVLGIVAGTSGCEAGTDRTAFREPATPLWEASAHVVGSAAVGNAVVAAYVRDGDGLSIAAWRVADGLRLWRHAAIIGEDPPGIGIHAAVSTVDGKDVVALLDRVDGAYRLYIIDGLSGLPLKTGGDHWLGWATRPHVCKEGAGFCFDGRPDGAEKAGALRATVRGGYVEVAPDHADRTPVGARMLTDRVFSTNDRAQGGVEKLGRIAHDGSTVWSRPYRDVFGPFASSDMGWNWRGDDASILVGTGSGLSPDVSEAIARGRAVIDHAGDRRMVALDASTGRTLWTVRDTGSCPPVPDLQVLDGIVVACRIDSGSVIVEKLDGTITDDWSDIRASLIGVRVGSGEIAWETPLRARAMDPDIDITTFLSTDGIVVLAVDDGAVFIDRRSGRAESVDDGVLACVHARTSLVAESVEYEAGSDIYPCHADGRKAEMFSTGAVRAAGIEGAGVRIVGTTRGLAAFRM
jgi:outer membrane protein assembly factor BamB